MARQTNFADMIGLGWSIARLGAEAQMVMTMRLWGMAGLWTVPGAENDRMVAEKMPAFARAQVAMTRAALSGHRPDQIWSVGVKSLTGVARSNRRRLARG